MAAATQITLGLDLCKKITEQYKLLSSADNKSKGLLISGQQCMLVCNKLLETQGTLELLQCELSDEETSSPDVGRATQELVQVLTRAYETFFKECFCNEWMESALRQHGDLKETASGILYDLQWYRSILCSILLKHAGQDNQALMPEDCHGMLSVLDRYALTIAAKRDQKNLKALLRDLKENHTCSGECWDGKQVSTPCLAAQLLKKFDFQAQSKAAQKEYYEQLPPPDRYTLSKWPLALLISQKDQQSEGHVGSGGFAEVSKVVWRGETYAMKRPSKPWYINIIKQEIEVLVVVTGFPSQLQIDGVNVTAKKFKADVRQGKRPNLPPDCPACLSGLIKQCWHADPLLRPSFPDICTELRYIKGLLLTDDKSTLAKLPPNEGFQGIKEHEVRKQVKGAKGDVMWLGNTWSCRKRLQHFHSFLRNGIKISVHNFVYVLTEEDRHIAYVEDMYEDKKMRKKLRVRWFHKTNELPCKIPPPAPLAREVFFTSFPQVLSVECVDGLATVLSPEHFEKCLSLLPAEAAPQLHVCSRQLDNSDGLKPFSIHEVKGYWHQQILSSVGLGLSPVGECLKKGCDFLSVLIWV
ncbi:hypothetical protein BDL97_10G075300 [Sphagnum fallax]|nr:hypothetical protein BDL97_10G075300 [Sphagnum fallax]